MLTEHGLADGIGNVIFTEEVKMHMHNVISIGGSSRIRRWPIPENPHRRDGPEDPDCLADDDEKLWLVHRQMNKCPYCGLGLVSGKCGDCSCLGSRI